MSLLVVCYLPFVVGAQNSPEALPPNDVHTFDAFVGFQPAGLGTPDEEWILHLTDVPYFFGSSDAPAVYAGYDAYLYPDRTALLIEYRQSKGKIYERINEWAVSPEEFTLLQKLIGELDSLRSNRQAGSRHQQALAKQSLPSKWDTEHLLSFSTLFKFKKDGNVGQVELFDLNPKINPLPEGLWEAADILRPLPPLFLYGSSP
jgi:hypothetical protein